MGLELLYASPGMITNMHVSPWAWGFCHVRSWDAFALRARSTPGETYVHKLFYDGRAMALGEVTGSSMTLPAHDGRVCYMMGMTNRNLYFMDEIACVADLNNQLNTSVMVSPEFSCDRSVVHYMDKRIYEMYGSKVLRTYGMYDGLVISTIAAVEDPTFKFTNPLNNVAMMNTTTILSYEKQTGKVIGHNIYSGAIAFKGVLCAGQYMAFDAVNQVFAVIDSAWKLRIYSTVNLGASLTAPVVLAGSITKQSCGGRVRTQCLDAHGAPVANKWIVWSLANWKGSLDKYYTKTNEYGYAYNYYYGPTQALELGAEAIIVEAEV